MRRHVSATLILSIPLILISTTDTLAGWPEYGLGIGAYPNVQHEPVACPDGSGGVYFAWTDARNGTRSVIYVQRVDGYGNALWTSGGVAVSPDTSNAELPAIAPNDSGGVNVVWEDERDGFQGDIYAQRLDQDGNALWTAGGRRVNLTTVEYQRFPVVIPDGTGGAYVAYESNHTGDYVVFIHRLLAATGSSYFAWGIGSPSKQSRRPDIAPDGQGGVYIAYETDYWGNYDIALKRYDSYGGDVWYGLVWVCRATGGQGSAQIVWDGYDGAIVGWVDPRNVHYDIFAQRINGSGTALWTADGEAVCSSADNQWYMRMVSDGAFGAYFAWRDDSSTPGSIRGQHMNSAGSQVWAPAGLQLGPVGNAPDLTPDGTGGVVVCWTGINNDIYGQRLGSEGNAYWSVNGEKICAPLGDQEYPRVASDGAGGAYIAWRDLRGSSYDVYAQRVERNGYWGYPSPDIASVADVPADQGGFITVSWDASRLDPWPHQEITEYTVWKAIDPAAASNLFERGAVRLTSATGYKPGVGNAPVVRVEQLAGTTWYWELVATQMANYYEHYSKRIASDYDSTASNPAAHYFQVCAHTSDPLVCWTSQPDSGYSVDNLAPCAPTCAAGEQTAAPGGIRVTWCPNPESDLDHYAVYRGTSVDFVPGPGNLLGAPCDTLLVDGDWTWDSGYVYKLSAIDVHGNESPFAVLNADLIVGVESRTPALDFLAQNHPNPFSSSTTISFGLRKTADIRLTVYDVVGRQIRSLVSRRLPGGPYAELWDGRDDGGRAVSSGVYFYRLTIGERTFTRKMSLIR